MRLFLTILICSLLLGACNPDTHLDVKPYTSKLVIDGSIEQNAYSKVFLSYSASYFQSIDSTSIRKLLATTAKVTVSDGIEEEILTLTRDENYFPPYVYIGTSMKGVAGKTYSLKVELRGETYTAKTTIPPPVNFDSLWFKLEPGRDSLGFLYGKFKDDPNEANYYRVFTFRKHVDTHYVPVYLSAMSDEFFNGEDFTFSILRGPENFTNIIDDLYFKIGDSVGVKLCTMDKAHFDFWRTIERELYVVGNPFSSSGNDIISNIDDKKALGVWGGYGASYYWIVPQ